MDKFLRDWFSWFEEGIASLEDDQKSLFFSTCAKNCVKSGVLYQLVFRECTCKLAKYNYIKTDEICECSRQSILHIMKCFRQDLEFKIDKISTILDGSNECRFIITVLD